MRKPGIENYKNVLGLSCIENHILAIFNANDIDNSIVFKNSFIDLERVGDYFLAKRANYAKFSEIPRIQHDLKECGAISMKLGYSKAWKNQKKSKWNKNICLLASIIPEQASEIFYTRRWRSDHYVLVERVEEKIKLINDIPAMELIVSEEKFSEMYGGTFFDLRFNEWSLKELSEKTEMTTIKKLIEIDVKKANLFQFISNDMKIEILPHLRDLIGVCRVIYARQIELLKRTFDCSRCKELLATMSSIYMQLEYYNLKKQFDLLNIQKIVRDIENIDYEFQNVIKKGVINYEYNRRKNQQSNISVVTN